MGDRLPAVVDSPEPEEVTRLLERAGAASTPKKLGISRELFRRSVIHALEVRTRFSIFDIASKMGLLEEFADVLTGRFYD
jgi:glycerol-1-phosphate dehydrogenase [NAD(P)+]